MTEAPLPHLILYRRAACELCDEARAMVDALLADRRSRGLLVPTIEERDIDTDPAWHDEHFATIPVVELGTSRLETVTSLAKLRRLMAEQLDGIPA